ncbi:hypothetical protein MFIFM68171_09605 [Madurella fahalii]|uniref:Uncharacterized protein n=1 Tax=Madurella fahalii TaxID=1157608 RepID=A0ABQ0GNT2_9PEZI
MSKTTEKQAEPFGWLSRENRGPTYISFSPFSHRTASSFEFGDNGYAGCCNYGGELIHLAARSQKHGIICVRGYRSTSLYGTLAQTQGEFGGPSSFGLEVSAHKPLYRPFEETTACSSTEFSSSFRPGKLTERGCFNYRWPLYEYALFHNDADSDDGAMNGDDLIAGSTLSGISSNTTLGAEEDSYTRDKPDTVAGTYTLFSFVKDGVFHQVLRLEQDTDLNSNSGDARQIVLTVGGNMWFRTFHEATDLRKEIVNRQRQEGHRQRDKRPKDHSSKDTYRVEVVHAVNDNDRLKMEIVVSFVNPNGSLEPLKLRRSNNEMDSDPESVPAYNACWHIPQGEQSSVLTFIATFRLSEYSEGSREMNDDKRTEDDTGIGAGKRPKRKYEIEEMGDKLNKTQLLHDKTITSNRIRNYVAADIHHVNAIGDLWLTVFVGRELQELESGSLLTDANLVGRCLERILQVEMFPVGRDQRQLALVSNLFLWPNVDLKALFWKVRFLVKTCNFLYGLQQRCDVVDSAQSEYSSSRPAYCLLEIGVQRKRIRDCINLVVQYLVEALLSPGSDVALKPDTFVRGDSNYYYVMLTIWYVAQNLEQTGEPIDRWNLVQAKVEELHKYLPHDNWNFQSADRSKVTLLKWYHYASILSLHCQGLLPLPETWERAELEAKVARLEVAARVTSATQLSSKRPYQVEDEIFDRMTLIVDELGFNYANCNVRKIASFSVRRITQRTATRAINPGWYPSHEDHPTSAPWEVHALCHHSRLMVLSLDPDWEQWSEEVETIKDQLGHFLNTEGTLVACWERAYSKASRGWLRSETTAVVASTVIDLLAHQIGPGKPTEGLQVGKQEISDPISIAGNVFRGEFQQPGKTLGEASSPPPIDWMTVFAPPKKYHPDAFVQSLSDTRYVYRKKVLQKRIAIPSTLERFKSENPLNFTRETLQKDLEESLRSVVMQYLTHMIPPLSPWPAGDYNMSLELARIPRRYLDPVKSATQQIIRSCGDNPLRSETHQRGLQGYVNFISVVDIVDSVVDRDVKGFSGLIKLVSYQDNSLSPLSSYRVLDRLSRSLVDQDVQHRFLKLARLPSDLMEHLIYVLHPEVVTGLNHHVLCLSRFLCQKRSTWVSTITLKAWSVKPTEMSFNAGMIPQIESPGVVEFLVQGEFERHKSKVQHENMNMIPLTKTLAIFQRLSTVTMSTNFSGDFSKCTIISNLLEDSHVSETANRIRGLWQQFVHRPQTARCLAFLLILRELSKAIRQEYDRSIEEINNNIVSDKDEDGAYDFLGWLGNQFFKGAKLEADLPDALGGSNITKYLVQSLRRHTLQTIQLALDECVMSIMQAKHELLVQVREDQASLSPLLDRMCQEYLERVEDEFSQVAALSAHLDWLVQSTNRSMDVFSIVTSMVDSHSSLQQNRTIQKLTYVTIGYLPVGLITAILAIPKEQEVVSQPFGLKYYLTALLSLFFITCIVAVKVDSIIPFLSDWFLRLPRALRRGQSVKEI